MNKRSLNGNWKLTILGENVFNVRESVEAKVPGSVYQALLDNKLMPDPYYRDNELTALKLMENDFVYETKFSLSEKDLEENAILSFDGIDTLGDVYVNDILLGSVKNMFRAYEFSLTSVGKVGENDLKIVLHSPTKFIREENKLVYTGGSHECMEGFPHLRKEHCSFGWDWGPRLPDAGIYKDVNIITFRNMRLVSVYVKQLHEADKVTLSFDVCIGDKNPLSYKNISASDLAALGLSLDGTITSPSGDVISLKDGVAVIENPALWYPRGYGKQPLYTVSVFVSDSEGIIGDYEEKIGLRVMKLNRDPIEDGELFAHEVNGVKVFAMGAAYVPEDNILSRVNKERTRRLLTDATMAGMNTLRVWGGGYYLDDYFYEICDELGILIWQDFMFACASYELDDDFEENISEEIAYQLLRLRNHPCIALWCANNEMESQTLDKAWKPSIKQKYDYIKIFENLIPKFCKKLDPQAPFWPSSPSSGGNYDNPWDPHRGDTHDWSVWHGEKPFTFYRRDWFSYVSEFGFQSFPSMKTISSFAEPEDLNIFSRVMEMHQRNPAANAKIMKYLGQTYLYPENFERLLYLSQLLQAEGMKVGIEHLRRHRGKCMGALVWQLNDIWPVASWASIDYFGRWKALHYIEKRSFEPIHISCEDFGERTVRPYCILEPGDIEFSARLHIANETCESVRGVVKYKFVTTRGELRAQGEKEVVVNPYDGLWLEKQIVPEEWIFDTYLKFEFVYDSGKSEGYALFTEPKHFKFNKPSLSVRKDGNKLIVTSDGFAKNVELEGIDGDCVLSDNYFDMEAETKEIEIIRGDATEFRIRSVAD